MTTQRRERRRSRAFLDARAAAVVQADDRRADQQRLVHDLADLFGMALRQRAAEDGEILDEDIDEAAVDRARPGDDAIPGNTLVLHSELDAVMLDLGVEFHERALSGPAVGLPADPNNSGRG